jgi:flagellar motor protein MotB
MDSSTLPETIVDPTRAAEEKPPPAAPKQSITWPIVSVEGVKVTTSDRECAMVFDSGVFSYRTTISPEAAKALRAVAGQVRGSLADLTLVIEGHADMTPASAATGDNNSLSLARANVVLDFLKSQCELPAASMTATSKGADDPPYSNDDEASRLKNRTVILRLVPQDRK